MSYVNHWVLADSTHEAYDDLVAKAAISHNKCLPDNELAIRENNEGTQAIIKVACSTGAGAWSTNAAIVFMYTDETISLLRNILSSAAWVSPENDI